jgi:hypothetical protein
MNPPVDPTVNPPVNPTVNAAPSNPDRTGPARNRVTPMGDIVAIALRGAYTGNRGVLHADRDIVRFHAGDLWITCALRFRGRRREQWLPGRYTHLYFHDEAVSFAAGHRPCGECRRTAYNDYRDAWATGLGEEPPSARTMNRRLHAERLYRGTHHRRLHERAWAELPDGAFVRQGDAPALVLGGALVEWTFDGYGARRPRPVRGSAEVITPPSTLAVLRAGYPVRIDDCAR